MSCEQVQEWIPKVVDREALAWERAAVEEHLAGCAACAELRAELVEIGALVRGPILAAADAADFSGLWPAVSAGIDRELAAARRERVASRGWDALLAPLSRWVAGGLVAAAAAAAVWIAPPAPHLFPADLRVEVSEVEGGADHDVMIYESQDENVTFILVMPKYEADHRRGAPI